ncbi:hypothetical protein RIF29_29204 [Crotalaria pallida]|uniref:Uncharacterized protein n=1 Tax=Crotalaria pallida TaxID=3830 RepID=A0AAN9EGA8_CROPI
MVKVLVEPIFTFVPFKLCEFQLLSISLLKLRSVPVSSRAPSKDGSDIVVEGPRCSLRSRKVYSDLSVNYLKMFLLNVPATVLH